MRYKYFVSYSITKDFQSGMGMCEYVVNRKITTYDHIEQMVKTLEKKNSGSITIINYRLLEE